MLTTAPCPASAGERHPDLLDMVEVMLSSACNVSPEGDAHVAPRSKTHAIAVGRRDRSADAEVVLAEITPHAECRLGVWVEWCEPLSAPVILDLRKRRPILSEDEPQAHRRVHFVEHEVTDDHVGRPLAGGRDAVKPVGCHLFQKLRKDNQALPKYRKLPVPVLGHVHPLCRASFSLFRRPPARRLPNQPLVRRTLAVSSRGEHREPRTT